jgi:hypothetical protein
MPAGQPPFVMTNALFQAPPAGVRWTSPIQLPTVARATGPLAMSRLPPGESD